MLDNFAPVSESLRGAYLAVGNFDGVHRGHARLIARLRDRAKQANVPAVALTFDPPPTQLLRPDTAPKPLSWTTRKVELLKQAGADDVGVFRTGPWLLGLTAREFFDRVVVGQFGATGMVEGPTFGFGRDRGGDATILGSWCHSEGLGFEVVEPTEYDGRLISSSRIRLALDEGNVLEAADLLGRLYRLKGRVVKGAGRGSTIGFPTANLSGIDTMIPADGVYAVRVFLEGESASRIGAAHIGANATFGETARTVEVHVLDFDRDLYGVIMEIEFDQRLRGSRKFSGVDELLAQIQDDIRETRIHATS